MGCAPAVAIGVSEEDLGQVLAARPDTAFKRRRRQGPAAENHPATFADLVSTVTAFAAPLATGAARGRAWDPATRAWQAV
jgi:hypothetical protein